MSFNNRIKKNNFFLDHKLTFNSIENVYGIQSEAHA